MYYIFFYINKLVKHSIFVLPFSLVLTRFIVSRNFEFETLLFSVLALRIIVNHNYANTVPFTVSLLCHLTVAHSNKLSSDFEDIEHSQSISSKLPDFRLSNHLQRKADEYNTMIVNSLEHSLFNSEQLKALDAVSSDLGKANGLSQALIGLSKISNAGALISRRAGIYGFALSLALDYGAYKIDHYQLDKKETLLAQYADYNRKRAIVSSDFYNIIEHSLPATKNIEDKYALVYALDNFDPKIIANLLPEDRDKYFKLVQRIKANADYESQTDQSIKLDQSWKANSEILTLLEQSQNELINFFVDVFSTEDEFYHIIFDEITNDNIELKELLVKVGSVLPVDIDNIKEENIFELLADLFQQANARSKEIENSLHIENYKGLARAFSISQEIGAYFKNKKLLRVGAIGGSIIEVLIAKDRLFSLVGQGGLAMLSPISGIVSSLFSLFKIFDRKKRSNDPTVQMFNILLHELRNLELMMHTGFEHTFSYLHNILSLTTELMEQLNFLIDDHVIPRLDTIQSSLDGLYRLIQQQGIGYSLNEMMTTFHEVDMAIANKDLYDASSCIRLASRLVTHTLVYSIDPISNGQMLFESVSSNTNDQRLLTKLLYQSSLSETDLAQQIQLVTNSLTQEGMLLLDVANIPNPLIWCAAVEQYLQFEQKVLSTKGLQVVEANIQSMISIGQQYIQLVNSLQNKPDVFNRIIDRIIHSLTKLNTWISSEKLTSDIELKNHYANKIDNLSISSNLSQLSNDYSGYDQFVSMKIDHKYFYPIRADSGKQGNRYIALSEHDALFTLGQRPKVIFHGILNLAALMQLGRYNFWFYISMSDGRGQWWLSKRGPNGESNGLSTVFIFNDIDNKLELTKAYTGNKQIKWIGIEGTAPSQKSAIQEDQFTHIQVINLIEVERLINQKIIPFRQKFKERINLGLNQHIQQYTMYYSLLIAVFRIAGFPHQLIEYHIYQRDELMNKFTTEFKNYNTNSFVLFNYTEKIDAQHELFNKLKQKLFEQVDHLPLVSRLTLSVQQTLASLANRLNHDKNRAYNTL